MHYEEELIIDEFQLDKEWREQPSLYLKYSNLSAELDAERKKAKENVEIVFSELYFEFKSNADAIGDKITEAALKAKIQIDSRYKTAKEELIQAEYNYNILSNAVKAFEQRKSALENLVKLLIGGFYSEPKQDKITQEKQEELKGAAQREALRKKRMERLERKNKKNN